MPTESAESASSTYDDQTSTAGTTSMSSTYNDETAPSTYTTRTHVMFGHHQMFGHFTSLT